MPLVFVISGLFAALAGVLFAINYRQVHPFMGEALGLKGISAMVVGGMGNIWGAIAGGLIIGLAEAFSIRFLGADFVDIGLRAAAADSSSGRQVCSAARARERAHERLSRRRTGAARDQHRVALTPPFCRSPRPAQSRSRRICAIGGYPSASSAKHGHLAVARHAARRARGRAGRAGCRNSGVAHPRHLPGACDLRVGEIVRATILDLEVVGGAAGYPVSTFIRLPVVARLAAA